MDVAPPNQHPATSDDELAKVLAGIGADDSAQHAAASQTQSAAEAAGLQFEETPGPIPPVGTSTASGATTQSTPVPTAPAVPTPPVPLAAQPAEPPVLPTSTAAATVGNLDELKKTALEELRPLVGKLDLPPEDKFDTLLLIIRSTDDQSLLQPAHETAKAIPDENKRAQALLDIIKEIDYFSQPPQPAAQ